MGCTSSSERAVSIRVSRSATRRASGASKGMAITDSTYSMKENDEEPVITSDEFEQENTRISKFKANDRASLAAALEEYEGSNHTASTSTRSADSAVICIVRSDKLAFSGHGIRRHSRRKRKRHNGNDNTRIIVLRKPSRRDTTMMKVDERIPMQECPLKNLEKEKKSKKKSRGSGSSETNSYKARHPKTPRNKKYYSKKLLSSPIRTPSILNIRKSSTEISDIMMIEDETSRDQILRTSVSSRHLLKKKSVNALQ